MPAPGDQHTPWANPFEEEKTRAPLWTPQELAVIASKLDKQLGPEFISSRAGPGGSRVHYLTAEKVITLANEVFGFNGWSSSIQNIQVDFADENPQTQRVSIGLSVIVRVTLRNGTYHEDIGYGSIENAKGKATGFEKAKKEGTTDGLKRALRSFGNVLGNCIYDSDYVKQVTKIKVQPIKKFSADNLHRHSDFAKKEPPKDEASVAAVPMAPPAPAAPTGQLVGVAPAPIKLDPEDSFEDFFGELDGADFCVPGEGHPDEVVLPNVTPNPSNMQSAAQPSRASSNGSDARNPQTPNQTNKRPASHTMAGPPVNRPVPTAQARPPTNPTATSMQPPAVAQTSNAAEPVGFFSAKAVSQLPSSSLQGTTNNPLTMPRGAQLFNPKAESPSIRKTPGIDHNSSKPLARSGQHVAPTASQSQTGTTSNGSGFVPVRPSPNAGVSGARGGGMNPSFDHTRRIGAPGGPGSPLANRGSYRPPTMKRPLPGDSGTTGGQRTPLAEIPPNGNASTESAGAAGLDSKRQKMT